MGTHSSDYTITLDERMGVYGKEWTYTVTLGDEVIATDGGFSNREAAYNAGWTQKHNELAIRQLREGR